MIFTKDLVRNSDTVTPVCRSAYSSLIAALDPARRSVNCLTADCAREIFMAAPGRGANDYRK
jgi:hypothetical protein